MNTHTQKQTCIANEREGNKLGQQLLDSKLSLVADKLLGRLHGLPHN
jgi:hypothetical protein